MSRTLSLLVLIVLFAASGAVAEPAPSSAPPAGNNDAASSSFVAAYSAVFSPGACSARPSPLVAAERDRDFLLGISPLAGGDTSSAEAGPYCTRAIDPFCVGCYVGCPEGCWCICGDWFAQCCCDVS